jgi:hypothetical protein
MWVVYLSKDWKEKELIRKQKESDAIQYKLCHEGCYKLSGYCLVIRKE